MPKKSVMFQTGTIRSLLQGVYDGDQSIAELGNHGDYGLGTFDAVDGELIAVDGVYYRADVNVILTKVPGHTKTPFAVVTQFQPLIKLDFSHIDCLQALESEIARRFISKNIMYAVEVRGRFADMDLRSEACQLQPYQPLAETLPKLQSVYQRNDIAGVMVGLWFPEHMSALNVAGFHFHFVDADRTLGGHVLDMRLLQGQARIQPIHDFAMHLIDSKAFAAADLDTQDDAAVAAVEKNK